MIKDRNYWLNRYAAYLDREKHKHHKAKELRKWMNLVVSRQQRANPNITQRRLIVTTKITAQARQQWLFSNLSTTKFTLLDEKKKLNYITLMAALLLAITEGDFRRLVINTLSRQRHKRTKKLRRKKYYVKRKHIEAVREFLKKVD